MKDSVEKERVEQGQNGRRARNQQEKIGERAGVSMEERKE
jgi:hypothetical protein